MRGRVGVSGGAGTPMWVMPRVEGYCPVKKLTRLFESVRYGAASPSREEEQEAIACLSAIVKAYGQS